MRMNPHLQKLEREAALRRARINELQAELRGLEQAIQLIKGDEPAQSERPLPLVPASRGALKAALLDVLSDHLGQGLKAADVAELASARGVKADRNSVGSLLSKLTHDGVLLHDKETRRYKLAQGDKVGVPTVALKSVA
jgi:hypothetical protein